MSLPPCFVLSHCVVVSSIVLVVFQDCVTVPGTLCRIIPVGRADTKNTAKMAMLFMCRMANDPDTKNTAELATVFVSG